MFKKKFFLLCALTAAYAPVAAVAPETMHEDRLDSAKDKTKCCYCCSLMVTNNASIDGNLIVTGSETVGGPVTATRFITPSGGPLLNWAVFSNTAAVDFSGRAFLWGATPPTSITAGITHATGLITLPVGGTFLVMYTVRITAKGPTIPTPGEEAVVFLEQGSTSSSFEEIALIILADGVPAGTIVQSQVSGYVIVTTTSTADNQIILFFEAQPNTYTVDATSAPDANANMVIFQLK